jgi:hypothetical protein
MQSQKWQDHVSRNVSDNEYQADIMTNRKPPKIDWAVPAIVSNILAHRELVGITPGNYLFFQSGSVDALRGKIGNAVEKITNRQLAIQNRDMVRRAFSRHCIAEQASQAYYDTVGGCKAAKRRKKCAF